MWKLVERGQLRRYGTIRRSRYDLAEVRDLERARRSATEPGKCSVDDCDSQRRALGYCVRHYKRFARHGDVSRGRMLSEDAGYYGAHKRLYRSLGKASEYQCVHCDQLAAGWAYMHDAPDERIDSRGFAYSLDPDFYRPMCVPCHKAFDLAYAHERMSA